MKWNEYFIYDETSPTGLRWNRDVFAGRTGKSRIVAKGDVAGNLATYKNGYQNVWMLDLTINWLKHIE